MCDLRVHWSLISELYGTLVPKFQSLSLSSLEKVEENNAMFPASIITFSPLLVAFCTWLAQFLLFVQNISPILIG